MVMLDETGARELHRTYSPFGEEYATVGSYWLPSHYGGHLKHEESGLVYMQARWMDPASGAFLSVDPLVADAGDPQSFNAYAYARNNPVSNIDPTGAAALYLDIGGQLVVIVTPNPTTPTSSPMGFSSFISSAPGGSLSSAPASSTASTNSTTAPNNSQSQGEQGHITDAINNLNDRADRADADVARADAAIETQEDEIAGAEQALARTIKSDRASLTDPMSRILDGTLAGLTHGRQSLTGIQQDMQVYRLKQIETARANLGRIQAYRGSRAAAAAFYRGRATSFQAFLNGRVGGG